MKNAAIPLAFQKLPAPTKSLFAFGCCGIEQSCMLALLQWSPSIISVGHVLCYSYQEAKRNLLFLK